MVAALELADVVREARSRTRVPGVVAGLLRDGRVETAADGVLSLGRPEPVRAETPFRIASISKPFTASLAALCLPRVGDPIAAYLSHTAGLRPESTDPLPPAAEGLFSYSNAGYWVVGRACAAGCETAFEDAMRTRLLEPLGLRATGYDEPPGAARGHLQEGATGHRPAPHDLYPSWRRPSGGLWSTVGDLLAFAAHHLGGPGPLGAEARAALREPRADALGARYGLGWWIRDGGGPLTLDHEGSTAGYQSLLLLVPDEAAALAVLTNSWRGSGLIRRVVERLGLAARLPEAAVGVAAPVGRYRLDEADADVVAEAAGGRLLVAEHEIDPTTRAEVSRRYPVRALGGDVYGFAGGTLMSHRLDFPREDVARIGWVAMTRVGG